MGLSHLSLTTDKNTQRKFHVVHKNYNEKANLNLNYSSHHSELSIKRKTSRQPFWGLINSLGEDLNRNAEIQPEQGLQ